MSSFGFNHWMHQLRPNLRTDSAIREIRRPDLWSYGHDCDAWSLPCCLVFAISQSSSPSISISHAQGNWNPSYLESNSKSGLETRQKSEWSGSIVAGIGQDGPSSVKWNYSMYIKLLACPLPIKALIFFNPRIPARFQQHLPVTFRGGMKVDHSGRHAFLFMRRAGLVAS